MVGGCRVNPGLEPRFKVSTSPRWPSWPSPIWRKALEDIIREWLATNRIVPTVATPTIDERAGTIVPLFPELGRALVEALARTELDTSNPSIRELARTRHELSLLLGQMLIEVAAPPLREFQAAMVRAGEGRIPSVPPWRPIDLGRGAVGVDRGRARSSGR